MHKRDSSDRPKYIFGKLGDVNQHSIGRTNIPFGGGIGFGCRPQASVLEKYYFQREKNPHSTPSSVRLQCFFPLWSVRLGSEMPLQMLWSSPRMDRKCAPLPGGVANNAQRKMLGKRKRQKGISYSPSPCRLIILFAYLYVHLDSPPTAGAWTGLDDTRPIPRLLKESRHGVNVQKLLSLCTKWLIYERDCM